MMETILILLKNALYLFKKKFFLYFKVGDIIRVEANSSFPCDMVMFSSHDPEGNCYITTANLDGETNLKVSIQLKKANNTVLPFSVQSH